MTVAEPANLGSGRNRPSLTATCVTVADPANPGSARNTVEHDKWFREQVEIGIREADAPDAKWYTHEDVQQRWEKRRAELLARIEDEQREWQRERAKLLGESGE